MPLLDLFFAMLWFFLFFIWIWLLISIFGDIFRSDMGGGAKAGWTIFVIFLPFLGVFVYLIVNGSKMGERQARSAQAMHDAQRDSIQSVAGGGSTADEISKLSSLRDGGTITAAEFDSQKAKLLA